MLAYDADFSNISVILINKPVRGISIYRDSTYVYFDLRDSRTIFGNVNLRKKINKYLEEKMYNENCI